MADTERLNQPTPPSDLTQRSDADIADWLRTVAFWASTVIGSPKSVKGVAVAYIEEAMRRLGREQAPASDADIATWQERHGLEGLSATDARACFEDAATLHMTMPLPVPSRPGHNDFLSGALAMRAALQASAERFREYERLHAAKPDMEKAKRNAEMAEMCEAALKGEK